MLQSKLQWLQGEMRNRKEHEGRLKQDLELSRTDIGEIVTHSGQEKGLLTSHITRQNYIVQELKQDNQGKNTPIINLFLLFQLSLCLKGNQKPDLNFVLSNIVLFDYIFVYSYVYLFIFFYIKKNPILYEFKFWIRHCRHVLDAYLSTVCRLCKYKDFITNHLYMKSCALSHW